jgi:hypothetical protein
VRLERRKWPLLSKPCTAIAKAMDLTAEGEAQLLLRARIDRAPERQKPMPHGVSISLGLHAFGAFLVRIPAGPAPGVAGDAGSYGGAVATCPGEASALLSPTTDSARGLHLFTTNHA